MGIKGTNGVGRVDPAKKTATESQRGETPEPKKEDAAGIHYPPA